MIDELGAGILRQVESLAVQVEFPVANYSVEMVQELIAPHTEVAGIDDGSLPVILKLECWFLILNRIIRQIIEYLKTVQSAFVAVLTEILCHSIIVANDEVGLVETVVFLLRSQLVATESPEVMDNGYDLGTPPMG